MEYVWGGRPPFPPKIIHVKYRLPIPEGVFDFDIHEYKDTYK
jgi:hypothetical protein